MVIITRYNPGEPVWFWAKDGNFKKALVYKVKTESKPKRNAFWDIANALIGVVKMFFSEAKYLVLENSKGENTNIEYTLNNGLSFIESRLFADEGEALDSIRLFEKHGEI